VSRGIGGGVRPAAIGLALVASFSLPGCSREPPLPGPNVVARLGEREIPYARFEAYLERNLGEPGGALASEALSRLFDQFVEEESLVALARQRGLAGESTPAAEAIGELLASRPRREPTDEEMAAEFERRKGALARPERVHLRQILVEDRLVAERARRELASGASFDDVVARATDEGSAPAGADQGELARDELPPAFASLIFALKDGEVSEVVPAGYGFHVFQVVRHLPAAGPSLAEAGPALRDELRRAAADAEVAALVREARSRYTVEVYDRNLPFTYRGSLPTSRPHENR
jgi:parvulin-like peptidyl-prolyl isomerase